MRIRFCQKLSQFIPASFRRATSNSFRTFYELICRKLWQAGEDERETFVLAQIRSGPVVSRLMNDHRCRASSKSERGTNSVGERAVDRPRPIFNKAKSTGMNWLDRPNVRADIAAVAGRHRPARKRPSDWDGSRGPSAGHLRGRRPR